MTGPYVPHVWKSPPEDQPCHHHPVLGRPDRLPDRQQTPVSSHPATAARLPAGTFVHRSRTVERPGPISLELTRMQGFQSATAFLDILNALATANRKVLMSNLCDSKNIVLQIAPHRQSLRLHRKKPLPEHPARRRSRIGQHVGIGLFALLQKTHEYLPTSLSSTTCVFPRPASFANTTLSASEICYACGFNNKSNFIRIFTKKKNMTPIEYRETSPRCLSNTDLPFIL